MIFSLSNNFRSFIFLNDGQCEINRHKVRWNRYESRRRVTWKLFLIKNPIFFSLFYCRIDKSEFQEWASRDEGLPSSSYASSIHEHFSTEHSLNRLNLVPYSSPGTTLVSNEFNNNAVIHTRSQDETNEYLAKTADIYRDPNPQILRRSAIDSPRRYEQRIIVRYLQPPDLQPPGVRRFSTVFPIVLFDSMILAIDYRRTTTTTTTSTSIIGC